MSESKLGTLPIGTEGRDAVHIAIVPCRAACVLHSGEPVVMQSDGTAIPNPAGRATGVVDPFLTNNRIIGKGQWFWLCLYPKTINNLRHVWEHPDFPASTDQPAAPKGSIAESEAWLRRYVERHCPYYAELPDKGLARFIERVVVDREIFYHGHDCHSLNDVVDADQLFHHLSVVLGKHINAEYFTGGFSCSC